MKKMNRSWKMVWRLAVMGMVAVPVCSVAAAQSLSLPQGTYHLSVMRAAAGQGEGQGTTPPVKDDLFTGTEIFAKGASDVTEITMDPDTLDLVGGKDGRRAHNMVLNVVRTYSYDKPGMYRMEDVDAFRNKLNTGDWHCSVHTRDLKTGDSTDVCNKRRSDGLAETAIITVSPKSLTFIHTIRRKDGSESEVGELPLVMSVPGLPAMAMLDPEAFSDMYVAMSTVNSGEVQAEIDSAMKSVHQLDSAEMRKQMQDAMKDLHQADTPAMQRQMQELRQRMKRYDTQPPTPPVPSPTPHP